MKINQQILLIDGDKVSLYLTKKCLKQTFPYKELIIKDSASSAFEYLSANDCPAHIIISYRMGEMNGYEFVKEFYKRGYKCEKICILSDGAIKEEDELGPLNIGYILKPVTSDKMTSVIRSFKPVYLTGL